MQLAGLSLPEADSLSLTTPAAIIWQDTFWPVAETPMTMIDLDASVMVYVSDHGTGGLVTICMVPASS